MATVLDRRPAPRGRLTEPTTPAPPQVPEEHQAPASDPARVERPHRVARVLNWLGSGLATAVMIALFLAQGALGVLPYRTSYVLTGSMTPTMPVGSLVLTQRVDASEVAVGDVITFNDPRQPGREVTHRVAAIESTPDGPVIVTKGDANADPDPWRIRQQGRLFRAVTSVPELGWPFAWLGARWMRWGGTVLPAIVLAGWCIRTIWRTEPEPRPQTSTEAAEREGSGLP
jgi:signal peptidase I